MYEKNIFTKHVILIYANFKLNKTLNYSMNLTTQGLLIRITLYAI